MGRYIQGWIECTDHNTQTEKQSWVAVKPLEDFLYYLKDYPGFDCLFGEDESFAHQQINEIVLNSARSFLGVMVSDDTFPFPPLAPGRGLPKDVSTTVKAEYDERDRGPEGMPACDVITSTHAQWIGWREIKKTDWEKTARNTDNSPQYYRNEQGEFVFRYFAWSISRPPASWISWQELKQVDWEEEKVWIDPQIYAYCRNEQGELVPQSPTYMVQFNEQGQIDAQPTPFSIQERFEKEVGRKNIDFSREQEWDLGDLIYRTEKKSMKRKEAITNWDRVFKVLEELAETHGDEGVRVIAWLD